MGAAMTKTTATATATGAAAPDRLHALDAVRAFALLLGVAFHASMSFLEPRIWIVGDASTSPAMDVFFFVAHIFRMTLFFVIAGFFARMLLERRGAAGFVKDRAKRILLPFVVFWPIVLASIIAVVIWSAIQANGGTPPANAPPPPPLTAQTFPLTHLWFLYVLMIFYAAALALRGVFRLVDRGGRIGMGLDWIMRAVMTARIEGIMLGGALAAALWFKPDWLMWFGVPTPDTGLIPNTPALIAFGAAFGFGWLLHRQIDLLKIWERGCFLNLLAAIAFTLACLYLAGVAPQLAPAPKDWKKLVFAACYVLAIWTWTAALIGLALRYLSGRNAVIRYLSDASYWIYIVHLPLVLALQTAFAPLPLPWYGKFAGILSTAFPLMLITYHLFVRYSFVGAILNGRKMQRRAKPDTQAAFAAAE
jgi:glucans biosynthesis protein C